MLRGDDGVVLPVAQCTEAFNNNFAPVFTNELPLNSSLNLLQPHVALLFEPVIVTAHGKQCAIE